MGNASKAVIFAGGTLIAVLIISVCMYIYTSFKVIYSDNMQQHEIAEKEAFNLFFVAFPSEITGYDAYNIIGKVEEINNNEDAITNITYSGINRDSEFYFTENFESKYRYNYTIDSDGLISKVTITK